MKLIRDQPTRTQEFLRLSVDLKTNAETMPIDPTHPKFFILSLILSVNSDEKLSVENERITVFLGVTAVTRLPVLVADLRFKQLTIR
jgi:hypothetical protein